MVAAARSSACLAGVDGCAGGWVLALLRSADAVEVRRISRFAEIAELAEAPAVLAVDIPIGLPERLGPGGRGPEAQVRKLLKERRASVFAVPSRSAVYAADYRQACEAALANSQPKTSVSRQLFAIAPKIREVDLALRADGGLARRVFECHPELAFWRLNGNRPLHLPKKVKGVPFAPGLGLRRELLLGAGLPDAVLEAAPPKGAGLDDVFDALACAVIARRIAAGVAEPFPAAPGADACGLRMAIWA